MATFTVPLRSDRWSELFTGEGTVDAQGLNIILGVGTTQPSNSSTAGIRIGGNPDSDDNRYAYDGTETVYARLDGPLEGEPFNVVVLQDGTTAAPVAPFLADIALSVTCNDEAAVAAPGLLALAEGPGTITITGVAAVAPNGAVTEGTVGTPLAIGTNATVDVESTGAYQFAFGAAQDALKADESVSYRFRITISDDTETPPLTDVADVVVTVRGVNDGPAAGTKVNTVVQGAVVTGNLLTDTGGGNTAASHPQAEALTVSKIAGKAFSGGLTNFFEIGAPGQGRIACNGLTGAYVYDPQGRAAGAHVIAFTVRDRFGLEASANLTVTVTAP